MAWTYDNQDWARFNNGQIELKNTDGSWSAAGTPEHSESAGYVTTAANSPEVDKLIAYARSGGTLNPEQQAFLANPLLGMDSYGQGSRWGGSLNLFDNQFSPQQAGALSISGLSSYLTPEQLAAGQQFVQQESPAAQSARDDDGGLFGGDLGKLAMLAAAIYTGGAAGGLWGGLGEGAALAAGDAMAGLIPAGELGAWTGAAGAAGAAGSTAGGGMGDLTDLWSQAFGEGGGWNPLTDGYGMGDAVSSAAGYGQNMATAAELAQMQAQYPDWYNALTGVTDVGISPSNIWNAFKAATGTGSGGSGLLSGGLTALGGYLQGTAGQDAATKAAAAQIQAAQIAADAAKFRPVGVTTRFGKSNFTKDANGNVIGAGYALTPDVKAQQDQLMAASGGMLNQFTGSQAATAPMGQAAQTMMTLGNNYLATTPEQQAQKYMAEQQALLATGRERDMNQMLTGEFNRGTYGLSTGGTSTGMMGANPRLEALYNAQRQQDLGLAAQATQGGMDYAKFGAGMVGSGGDMLKNMYGTQTASYDPYKTAMGGAQTLEGLGQNAMDLGVNLGKVTSNAQSGQLLGQGMLGASQTMQQADAYSPWGAMLTGAGNTMQNYGQQQQQQQYQFNPFTGVRL